MGWNHKLVGISNFKYQSENKSKKSTTQADIIRYPTLQTIPQAFYERNPQGILLVKV